MKIDVKSQFKINSGSTWEEVVYSIGDAVAYNTQGSGSKKQPFNIVTIGPLKSAAKTGETESV